MKVWRVAWLGCLLVGCNAAPSDNLPDEGGSGTGGGDSGGTSGGSGGDDSSKSSRSSGGTDGTGGGDSSGGGPGGGQDCGGTGGTTTTVSVASGGADSTTSSGTGGAANGGDAGLGGDGGSTLLGGLSGVGGGRVVTLISTTGTSTTDAGGAGGVGGVGGASASPGVLGTPCDTALPCPDPYVCLDGDTNSFQVDQEGTLGSIAHGVCTLPCADAYDCWDYDEWSVCLGFTQDTGYCMPYCIPGDGIIECAERTDMVCGLLPTGEDGGACTATTECGANQICAGGGCAGVFPVCLPNCSTDADCPVDRFCDPASGACLESARAGSAVGDACGDGGDCASGYCVEGICTRICTVGVSGGCGANGMCFPAFDVTTDPGDYGRCLSMCDCDADCANETCLSLQDAEVESALGYSGFCGEVLTGDIELMCN